MTLWYAPFTKGFSLNFTELLLAEPILRAVASEGYTVATPVQEQAIPHILRAARHIGLCPDGHGQNGGVCAADFASVVDRRAVPGGAARPRCLVLCPTRELAMQIAESFRVYGKHVGLRSAVVFGGRSQGRPQS